MGSYKKKKKPATTATKPRQTLAKIAKIAHVNYSKPPTTQISGLFDNDFMLKKRKIQTNTNRKNALFCLIGNFLLILI